jgi:hypothetical protein
MVFGQVVFNVCFLPLSSTFDNSILNRGLVDGVIDRFQGEVVCVMDEVWFGDECVFGGSLRVRVRIWAWNGSRV